MTRLSAKASIVGLNVISVLLHLLKGVELLNNGLARKPPMGWLAWERFTCQTDCKSNPNNCINSKLFMDMADRIVADGYLEAGYEYVNIDDCWSEKERDPTTQKLLHDNERFPEGITGLAEYIHSLNLKLGIYGDCGTSTCAGYPAQLKSNLSLEDNYFQLDANTLQEWHVDSFKFDGCYIDPFKAESICPKMATALTTSMAEPHSRPILLICEWPFYLLRHSGKPNFPLAQSSCNVWRYYEDVEDSWLSILNIVDFTVKMQSSIIGYHGPGNWFDPDQLVIGNFALSLDQAKAQMALWSIWSAPLYMSNDLRNIDPAMAAILKNKNLIAVNQDPYGLFGLMVEQQLDGLIQAFVKPFSLVKNGCPSFVVVYLYRDTLGNKRKLTFKVRDLLKKSSIEIAYHRHRMVYGNSHEGFNLDQCQRRINNGMTKEPRPNNLVVKSVGQQDVVPLEEVQITYDVFDLFENKSVGQVNLNSTLDLFTNPSGVRAVRLVEV